MSSNSLATVLSTLESDLETAVEPVIEKAGEAIIAGLLDSVAFGSLAVPVADKLFLSLIGALAAKLSPAAPTVTVAPKAPTDLQAPAPQVTMDPIPDPLG